VGDLKGPVKERPTFGIVCKSMGKGIWI
jgi:hypothetical protein